MSTNARRRTEHARRKSAADRVAAPYGRWRLDGVDERGWTRVVRLEGDPGGSERAHVVAEVALAGDGWLIERAPVLAASMARLHEWLEAGLADGTLPLTAVSVVNIGRELRRTLGVSAGSETAKLP